MKKLSLIFAILFSILTLVGAVYFFTHKEEANAGYAVIPMIIAMASYSHYNRS